MIDQHLIINAFSVALIIIIAHFPGHGLHLDYPDDKRFLEEYGKGSAAMV
jgi:hypothetical protein